MDNTIKQKNSQEYSESTVNHLGSRNCSTVPKKGRLILISKSSNPLPSLNDKRPLLIQSYFTKIIEKIIYNKLTESKSKLLETHNY